MARGLTDGTDRRAENYLKDYIAETVCHEVGHRAVSARLPPAVKLAYDGLTIEIDDAREKSA